MQTRLITGFAAVVAVGLVVAPASAAPGAGPAPNAQPQGGQVIGGSASITQDASTTTITQSTARATINWSSFDVGPQQTVEVQQPSAAAVTVMRVIGADPSEVAGHVIANGSVMLLNASGASLKSGSEVDASSFVASTATFGSNGVQAFDTGGPAALASPGTPNATVSNAGTITAGQHGLVALIGNEVTHSGTIDAWLGSINLIAARTATITFAGDRFSAVKITSKVRQVPATSDGKPAKRLISVPGTLAASGGRIRVAGSAADGIVTNLIQIAGKLRTSSVGKFRGHITVAAIGGPVSIVGASLAAAGKQPGSRGGTICIGATSAVTLGGGGQLTVNGRAGGGAVGLGHLQTKPGDGSICAGSPATRRTTIGALGSIHSNATADGDGGMVAVSATGPVTQSGPLTAKGGPNGGDGGTIELSAGGTLSHTGTTDVSAPHGTAGTVLLN